MATVNYSSLVFGFLTQALLVSPLGYALEKAGVSCEPKNVLPFVENEKFDRFNCSKSKGGDLDMQSLRKIILGAEMLVISQGSKGQKGSKSATLKFNPAGTYEFKLIGTGELKLNVGGSFGIVEGLQIESSEGHFKILQGGELQISKPFDSSCKQKIDANESYSSSYSIEYYTKTGKSMIILHKLNVKYMAPFYSIPDYSLFLPITDVVAKGHSKESLSGFGGNIFSNQPFFAYGCFDNELETFTINSEYS
ncbi:MAG: hypothetical protein EOP48_00130 [Sphingobacteriales bacterium]|nr:MAG: hypothetical protein EOP48_00130 [Sphingobacteriales bacterium]